MYFIDFGRNSQEALFFYFVFYKIAFYTLLTLIKIVKFHCPGGRGARGVRSKHLLYSQLFSNWLRSQGKPSRFYRLCKIDHLLLNWSSFVDKLLIFCLFIRFIFLHEQVRPNYGGIPVTVGVTLYILSIGDLSEKVWFWWSILSYFDSDLNFDFWHWSLTLKDMDFTFDMYFRQFWTDPRLSFDPVDFGINQLVVGSEYIRSDDNKKL